MNTGLCWSNDTKRAVNNRAHVDDVPPSINLIHTQTQTCQSITLFANRMKIIVTYQDLMTSSQTVAVTESQTH